MSSRSIISADARAWFTDARGPSPREARAPTAWCVQYRLRRGSWSARQAADLDETGFAVGCEARASVWSPQNDNARYGELREIRRSDSPGDPVTAASALYFYEWRDNLYLLSNVDKARFTSLDCVIASAFPSSTSNLVGALDGVMRC
jgi:hypothetical protein